MAATKSAQERASWSTIITVVIREQKDKKRSRVLPPSDVREAAWDDQIGGKSWGSGILPAAYTRLLIAFHPLITVI